MGEKMKAKIFLLIPFLIFAGCKSFPTSAVVGDNIPFADRDKKISRSIGLYISEQSRNYVASQFKRKDAGMSKSGVTFTLDFGKNLETNSKNSLGKVFNNVVPTERKIYRSGKYSYLMQIEIDERTKFDIGNFTFSKKKVNLYMNCTLYNGSGKVLWKETFDSESSRYNLKGFLASSPIFMRSSRVAAISKLEAAAEESLVANLEMLNTRMLEKRTLFR